MTDIEAFVADLAARGIQLIADSGELVARPRERLTDADRTTIRALKAEIVAYLRTRRAEPGWTADQAYADFNAPHVPDKKTCMGEKTSAPSVVPNSRSPLIPDRIRAKIEAIEAEARAKGWPAELLWNNVFWGRPRGLAAVLEPGDVITEVTPDHIVILTGGREFQRFSRYVT
jgi:hypothetical protein